METKSNNVLIGTFALLLIAAAFLFALWLGRIQLDRSYAYYEVVFQGSVSGLKEGGTVQYNGIQVGRVVDLHLAEDDPSKVVALIQVDTRTPVKEDSVAKLELYGLTGVALIELTGGSAKSAPLKAKPDQTYPIIPAAPSAFQELYSSAPETLDNANKILVRLNNVITQNETAIHRTLVNLDKVSSRLAGSSEDLRVLIKNLSDASTHLSSLSRNADRLVKDDIKGFVVEAEGAAKAYRRVADDLDRILAANGPAIDQGLGQLPQLVRETRALVNALDRIASRAENDPAGYFLGRDVPEVEAR